MNSEHEIHLFFLFPLKWRSRLWNKDKLDVEEPALKLLLMGINSDLNSGHENLLVCFPSQKLQPRQTDRLLQRIKFVAYLKLFWEIYCPKHSTIEMTR